MISHATGRSLHEGAHKLSEPHDAPVSTHGTPLVGPADPRPRCKQCGGPWNGSHLLYCDACEERHLDFMADARHELDERESDRELTW